MADDFDDVVYGYLNARGLLDKNGVLGTTTIKNDLYKNEKRTFVELTKASKIPIEEQLAWWNNALNRFKGDYSIVLECSKNIFNLTRDLVKNLNAESVAYAEERTYFNDWESFGDNAILAYDRVKERNDALLSDGIINWGEYQNNITEFGEALFNGRINQSKKWLEQELKYNGMSLDDYIDGLLRMKTYTEEYFREGIIDYKAYCDALTSINNEIYDTNAQKNRLEYSAFKSDANDYITVRNTFNDWDLVSDTESAFIRRNIDAVRGFYEANKISREQYIKDTRTFYLDLYRAEESAYNDLLKNQADYISETKALFTEKENALRAAWAANDRSASMAQIKGDMLIYQGAVTERGKDKYKELEIELKTLQREEELYRLELDHQATLDKLEEEYKKTEEEKEIALLKIRNTAVDASLICRNISNKQNTYYSDTLSMLKKILTAIGDVSVNVFNEYSDTSVNTETSAAPVLYSPSFYG